MTTETTPTEPVPTAAPRGSVEMDPDGRVRLPPGAANMAALLRIGLGLLYLWAFLSQGFGITYSNSATDPSTGKIDYGWHFDIDADAGWISSGFTHSPTAGYIDKTHGPTAWLVQNLPTGLDDFGWIFALGGLGVALTIGICMRIAGIGGFLLNMLIWFAGFPPTSNPIIDDEHMAFAFSLLLLMFLCADCRWGAGRWWRRHVPAFLH